MTAFVDEPAKRLKEQHKQYTLNSKKIIQYLAPFSLVFIILLFIYNVISHGQIDDPGQVCYKANCSQCHGENGEGIKSLVPPINGSDFAAQNIDSLPCWLKFGLNHTITVKNVSYDQPMYPFDTMRLDEVQIANLINYMSKTYIKIDKEVNPQWVRDRWKQCK